MAVTRPARLSDAASLAALAERTFRETFAADNSEENINLHCAQKFSAEIQGGEISDTQISTLLAEVASELMCAVYTATARAGCDCIWLGVWEHNPRAIAFYRKCGFSVVGDHVFMLGQDQQRDLILAAQVDGLLPGA
jgi:ribosomal protein S18 acetylase RimI-like enzyme